MQFVFHLFNREKSINKLSSAAFSCVVPEAPQITSYTGAITVLPGALLTSPIMINNIIVMTDWRHSQLHTFNNIKLWFLFVLGIFSDQNQVGIKIIKFEPNGFLTTWFVEYLNNHKCTIFHVLWILKNSTCTLCKLSTKVYSFRLVLAS